MSVIQTLPSVSVRSPCGVLKSPFQERKNLPAVPASVRRDRVGRLDLLPDVVLGIVAPHAGRLFLLVEDGDRGEQLAFRVERQLRLIERSRRLGELLDRFGPRIETIEFAEFT